MRRMTTMRMAKWKIVTRHLNERADGYLPEPPMEVEGMEETTNEGQIILLGKDIGEEDKGED